jgi:hypothetical protein
MDPNETIKQLRELAKRVLARADKGEEQDIYDSIEIAEKVQALDNWISDGGFLPSVWLKDK